MLELHNLRPGTVEDSYRGTGYISKFTTYTVNENGQSRNYDFEPEYDLVLYIYSTSPKIDNPFREVNVQYGYMYQLASGNTYSFPVFREIPRDDNRKVNVWKVDDKGWDENEVVRVSSNFYAYSLPENRDLKNFFEGAKEIVNARKMKLTEKYETDMKNQDKVLEELTKKMSEVLD